MHWLLGFTTFPQGKTMCSNQNIQFCVIFFSHSWISFNQTKMIAFRNFMAVNICTKQWILDWMHAIFCHKGQITQWESKDKTMYLHSFVSFTGACVYALEKAVRCVFWQLICREEVGPWGELTPKEPGNLFFLLQNLAISHFLKVPVPLTHSQEPSQSPFVNRTMFYNPPLFLRWPYQ